jgi:hypothetical protein
LNQLYYIPIPINIWISKRVLYILYKCTLPLSAVWMKFEYHVTHGIQKIQSKWMYSKKYW